MKINESVKDKIYFQGRILWKEDKAVMGYTNSSFTIHFRGTGLEALMGTGCTEPINQPGLRIYVDGKAEKEVVLDSEEQWVTLAEFPEAGEHTVSIGGTSYTFTNAEGYAATACYSDTAVEG